MARRVEAVPSCSQQVDWAIADNLWDRAEDYPMGRSWTYAAIERGEFPGQVKLGARAVGWRRSDIEAWLETLSA